MSSPEKPIDSAPPDTDNILLPDEILEEIFLRLASPADLARASTACVSFRRVVTDRPFLRRFRSLHKPPLLGLLGARDFCAAKPPHTSAPAARALAQAADFEFSFLPSPGRWKPRDCRVVLARLPMAFVCSDYDSDDEGELVPVADKVKDDVITDLAVCDPISRRSLILPAIPTDLATLVEQENLLVFEPFLAPAAVEEMDGTSFRVFARAHYASKVVIFVFSSSTEEWCSFKFVRWSVLVAVLRMQARQCSLTLRHLSYFPHDTMRTAASTGC
uniref:F-box domain-containing protein n=1 Tax=Leersia perrieri TaxID=77586 RepID=A0A0D9X089_9ORYZ